MAGDQSGSAPHCVAMVRLYFETPEGFQASCGPQAEEILADVPNYTDAEIVVQMSDVVINARRSKAREPHLHPG
jgi:uncharacterized protein (TIGR02118 family)